MISWVSLILNVFQRGIQNAEQTPRARGKRGWAGNVNASGTQGVADQQYFPWSPEFGVMLM